MPSGFRSSTLGRMAKDGKMYRSSDQVKNTPPLHISTITTGTKSNRFRTTKLLRYFLLLFRVLLFWNNCRHCPYNNQGILRADSRVAWTRWEGVQCMLVKFDARKAAWVKSCYAVIRESNYDVTLVAQSSLVKVCGSQRSSSHTKASQIPWVNNVKRCGVFFTWSDAPFWNETSLFC